MNLSQWVPYGTATGVVNIAQVEAVHVTGSSNPFGLTAVNGANTYVLDNMQSYTTAALAFAAAQALVGVGAALYPGDPTVTIGNVHDV